jgi:hypothetical protein
VGTAAFRRISDLLPQGLRQLVISHWLVVISEWLVVIG